MLIGLGYVSCSQPTLAIILLVLSVSLTGIQYSGFLVNHVDIAPAFAGILFGISNSLAAVTGFISPVIVGVITNEVRHHSFCIYIPLNEDYQCLSTEGVVNFSPQPFVMGPCGWRVERTTANPKVSKMSPTPPCSDGYLN